MSNSEASDITINWNEEASTPLSSWADEMDELDALEPSSPSSPTLDESQPVESPLASSSSSSDNEDDKSSTRELRSSDPNGRSQLRDSTERFPRSKLSLNAKPFSRRELRDSSNDISEVAPKTSVKEEVPFPTVAPFVAFITNVNTVASRDDISKILEPITGVPKSIKIILEKDTGRPRGFCYVEFEDAIGLRAAIDADGMQLMTQSLHIVVAEKKPTYQPRSNFSRSSDFSSVKQRGFDARRSEDHQDTKRHQPRMDSISQSSKGKFETPRQRKDDFKYQTQRSNSFTVEKRSPNKSMSGAGSIYREKTPIKKVNGRVVEEKAIGMTMGNMFSALQLNEDM